MGNIYAIRTPALDHIAQMDVPLFENTTHGEPDAHWGGLQVYFGTPQSPCTADS